jgi:hypothetical protein
MAYKKGMISYSELIKNGWTDRLIDDLLGDPDLQDTNKYNHTGTPMRLYSRKRVAVAEKNVLYLNHHRRIQSATESPDLSDFFS